MDNTKRTRCFWSGEKPEYIKYHDEEWGVPVHDDRLHFEMLILEGAQAGLSWYTILKKRDNYRQAFDHFDPKIVASYDEEKIESLLNNSGIVRNTLKIKSAVQNAKVFLAIQEEFGTFNDYVWLFTQGKPIINHWKKPSDVPATSPESDLFSKDLKKRGMKFVGSTIIYAYMQAVGLIDDHMENCFKRSC